MARSASLSGRVRITNFTTPHPSNALANNKGVFSSVIKNTLSEVINAVVDCSKINDRYYG